VPPAAAPLDELPAIACPPELEPLAAVPEEPVVCPPVPLGVEPLSLHASTIGNATTPSIGAKGEKNLRVLVMRIYFVSRGNPSRHNASRKCESPAPGRAAFELPAVVGEPVTGAASEKATKVGRFGAHENFQE
jgi:hypothetical protein